MPTFQPTPDLVMHYEVDDFADPWRKPETALLLHGNAESGTAWYGWVPHLARHYRVVRPDMRGFGASTPMPRDFPWTLDRLIEDFISLMDRLDCRRFRTAVSTQIGFMKTIACADIRADVPKIGCPTLVVTTDGSGLASVDQTRAWQEQIPDSRLLVLPGNSYHVAATHAARCSEATLDFIGRHLGAA